MLDADPYLEPEDVDAGSCICCVAAWEAGGTIDCVLSLSVLGIPRHLVAGSAYEDGRNRTRPGSTTASLALSSGNKEVSRKNCSTMQMTVSRDAGSEGASTTIPEYCSGG